MFISSDTNIWLDFNELGHLDHPFRLDYSFFLSRNTFDDEFPHSPEIRKNLLGYGLQLADLTNDEFLLAVQYQAEYPRLSFYDTVALAIAKQRGWILLTGDRALHQAADRQKVECHGSIWIYDQLQEQHKISDSEYRQVLDDLIHAVESGKRRLPLDELSLRRNKL